MDKEWQGEVFKGGSQNIKQAVMFVSPQCSLHIHAAYSTAKQLNVPMLPLSEPNAVGLIIAHGNPSQARTNGHTHTHSLTHSLNYTHVY